MGCNLCDECSDCTVGKSIDCSSWDDAHRNEDKDEDDDFFYDTSCYDKEDEEEETGMSVGRERYCVNCGTLVQLDWKYCFACGASLPEKHCVECGKEVDSDWDYCPWCGSELPDKIDADTHVHPQATPTPKPWPVVDASVYDEDIPF